MLQLPSRYVQMSCLHSKVLSIALIRDGCLQGVIFQEECRGEDLYRGGFSKKNNPLDLLQELEPATNVSLVATQKRASSIPETNGTFTIPGPGPSNDRYQMRFRLIGNTLPKPGMFSVVIDWFFGLGLEDSIHKVDEEASRQDPALPVEGFTPQPAKPPNRPNPPTVHLALTPQIRSLAIYFCVNNCGFCTFLKGWYGTFCRNLPGW